MQCDFFILYYIINKSSLFSIQPYSLIFINIAVILILFHVDFIGILLLLLICCGNSYTVSIFYRDNKHGKNRK